MFKVCWTEHKFLVCIGERTTCKSELIAIIECRKICYGDHVLRSEKYEFSHLILKGEVITDQNRQKTD